MTLDLAGWPPGTPIVGRPVSGIRIGLRTEFGVLEDIGVLRGQLVAYVRWSRRPPQVAATCEAVWLDTVPLTSLRRRETYSL
ncbi:hypothetical protein J5X84_36360 [Streptosporangiaceae bacterium NEAU-GS5]|nr:hypothetical protein [Streptosporangiaceae bacterium NEAU-GS5]